MNNVQGDQEQVDPRVNPPPPKKQRSDNIWRIAHIVRSRDQKIMQQMSFKKAGVLKKIDSLQKSLTKQKTAVKCLKKKQHVDVDTKEHRMVSLNLEEAHKRAIAELLKEHTLAIDGVFAKAGIETNKSLQLEQQQLEAKAGHRAKIREERWLANDKLEKEGCSDKAILLDSHAH